MRAGTSPCASRNEEASTRLISPSGGRKLRVRIDCDIRAPTLRQRLLVIVDVERTDFESISSDSIRAVRLSIHVPFCDRLHFGLR
jgi:hypothetical protein